MRLTVCATRQSRPLDEDRLSGLLGVPGRLIDHAVIDYLYAYEEPPHVWPRAQVEAVLNRAQECGSDTVLMLGVPPTSVVRKAEHFVWYAGSAHGDILAIAFSPYPRKWWKEDDEATRFYRKLGEELK